VTNEASLLHVAPALHSAKLKDRAYVGVGPEQNYTYLALLEPRIAYIVDIRRGNLLEHMMFRACFETGKTRAEFLTALLARRVPSGAVDADAGPDASFAQLDAAFRAAPPDPSLRHEGIARTKALLDRLAVARTPSDDKALARIHEAFAKHGLGIAYTMLNSGRRYPRLGETRPHAIPTARRRASWHRRRSTRAFVVSWWRTGSSPWSGTSAASMRSAQSPRTCALAA